MSNLNGSLEDVAAADVLRFAHHGRRTGILTLQAPAGRAEVRFVDGRIVSVRGPRSKPLGELLVERGWIGRATLDVALRLQQQVRPRRALGEILMATGVLAPEHLRELVRAQVEETIYEIVEWREGSFDFAIGAIGDMELTHPGDLIPEADLNTEALILGLARIVDEGAPDVLALAGKRTDPRRQQVAPPSPSPSAMERLHKVLGDLQAGLHTGTVALYLMQVLSEELERSVLFLVRPGQLAAVGAFGLDGRGRPLAERTRGIRVDLGRVDSLAQAASLRDGRLLAWDEAALPETVVRAVGRPRSGQVLLLPVVGVDRVIAVVYADNGALDRPIERLPLLQLIASQIGLALENELLRREVESFSVPTPQRSLRQANQLPQPSEDPATTKVLRFKR